MALKLFIGSLLTLLLFSCTKDSFTNSPDALLSTSVDTLHFDTVFTTTGSITQSFKIINANNKGIHIASIRLAGGTASPFKININGEAGAAATDMDVHADDSLYVFVSVHINPTSQALPFVARDSIEVAYNGNIKWVQLEAFGQNAHFYRAKTVTGNETWQNDLPYVILGQLTVAENASLTIAKGCKVYVHASAPFIVNGTLRVTGERGDSNRVVFTGDRLDDPYQNFPAGWPGIVFTAGSKDNHMQYATIKNAYQGIVVQGPGTGNMPKLTLEEAIIDNAYDAGIAGENTSITARNVLISNCGKNVVLAGGDYRFTHCTVAAYGNSRVPHKDPVLQVSNHIPGSGVGALSAVFRNCIIWGEGGLATSEIVLDKAGSAVWNVVFDHVLWPLKSDPADAMVIQSLNSVPEFDSINAARPYYDFHLKEISPAVNAGVETGVPIDLDGRKRPVGLPDLGAYERQ